MSATKEQLLQQAYEKLEKAMSYEAKSQPGFTTEKGTEPSQHMKDLALRQANKLIAEAAELEAQAYADA